MTKTTLSITLLCACLYLPTSGAEARSEVPGPERWFRDSYAPLWNDRPAQQLEAMLDHYADVVRSHRNDGEVSDSKSRDWLGDSLAEWVEEGWLRSELTALEVDEINASTATFKARWRDHYADAPEDDSCGWYLADRFGGVWRFTVYADLDCAAHDF